MKSNHNKIAGILHHKQSVEQYHLRRYFPDAHLGDLIEQFWLVDWDLRGKRAHTQQNLPDPNFHLILDNRQVKLIGPVSKAYSYKMEGKGEILGVKFSLGALSDQLELSPSNYVDKELDIQRVFDFDIDMFILQLAGQKSDMQIIEILQAYMKPFAIMPSSQLLKVRKLVALIKNESDITRVEHLSERTNTSVRVIQRCFQQYLGLSPKWLIRKYRLHQALELLERQSVNFADIVELLGYTDQSHLIRDFKDMIGVTPNKYIHT